MSNLLHLPAVVHFVVAAKPARILDIGVGMGTYGFMLRQYLDISQERVARDKWEITIDGAEIFEGYRNPVWDYAYNSVRIGDIRHMLKELPQYDVILCNDVLEHFEREEAILLLQGLLDKGRVVISTTPNVEFPQGAWGGNDAETHRCLLAESDFPHLAVWKKTGITNCYVCAKSEADAALLKRAGITCPVCRTDLMPKLASLPKRIAKKVGKVLGR